MIPLLVGTGQQGDSASSRWVTSLPFLGVETVRAAGGLTITKVANSPDVNQGGLLTYSLIITNGTGADIVGQELTDYYQQGASDLDRDLHHHRRSPGRHPLCDGFGLACGGNRWSQFREMGFK